MPTPGKYATISQVTPGALVYFNTTLSDSDASTPFIVLGLSKQGNSILLLQKIVYESKVFHTGDSPYYTSNIEKYLSADASETDSYRSKLPEAIRNVLVNTEIESYVFENKTTMITSKDIFLPSVTELGGTDSSYHVEGKSYLDVLKIAYTTDDDNTAKVTQTSTGGQNFYWTRTAKDKSSTYIIYTNGIITFASNPLGGSYVRPILSASPDTLVSEDSSGTISLLPTSIAHEIDISFYCGSSKLCPTKARLLSNILNADSYTISITNNYKDSEPVWTVADADGFANLSNTTKTTDKYELGVRVQAQSYSSGITIKNLSLVYIT